MNLINLGVDIAPPTAKEIVLPYTPIPFTDLVKEFILFKDISKNSKRLYVRTLRQFNNWLLNNCYNYSEISQPHILKYKEELFLKGLSSLTVASYITSLKSFYEWAEINNYCKNITRGVRAPKRKNEFKKQPLNTNQQKDLLTFLQSAHNIKKYAIINLLLTTGIRTIELTRANVGDIVYKSGKRVLLVQGKGREVKDNFVILTDSAYKPIAEYLTTRGKVSNIEPLFISDSNNSKGERLTTRTISKIAKDVLKAIGINEKCFTAHSLRHTLAVNILKAGGGLDIAQGTLRHSNPATTQIYTATLNEELRLQKSGEELVEKYLKECN